MVVGPCDDRWPATLDRLVGGRVAKARYAQEGKLGEVVSLLVLPGVATDDRRASAQIVGSVALQAAPPTLLALLRADAVYVLWERVHAVAVPGPDGVAPDLLALLRALRSLLRAVADHLGYSPRWGMGSGCGYPLYAWGNAENLASSRSLRQDLSWDAAGPSAADVRTPMTDYARRDAVLADDPAHELAARCREALSHMYDPVRLEMMLGLIAWIQPCLPSPDGNCADALCCVCDLLACTWTWSELAPHAEHQRHISLLARPACARPWAQGEAKVSVLTTILICAEQGNAAVQEASLWMVEAMLAACTHEAFPHGLPLGPLISTLEQLSQSRHTRVSAASTACLVQLARLAPSSTDSARLVDTCIGFLSAGPVLQVQMGLALARLLRDDHALQAIAMDGRRLGRELVRMLATTSLTDTAGELVLGTYEAGLTLVATLGAGTEAMRKKLVQCLPTLASSVLLPALSSGALGVQLAACRTIRVLSRSVAIARLYLYEPALADALVQCHSVPSLEEEVLAALSNLVLKYSPVRAILLEQDVLAKVGQSAHSTSTAVQQAALGCLQNAVWESEVHWKEAAVAAIGWPALAEVLVQRENTAIALEFIANLAASPNAPCVGALLVRLGEPLEATLRSALTSDRPREAKAARHVLTNLAHGTPHSRTWAAPLCALCGEET